MYFCLAIISDFLSLSAAPFFKNFLASCGVISLEFKTDKEITLSSLRSSIPLIPLEDLPLKILNFFIFTYSFKINFRIFYY